MARDVRDWMWAEALELLDQADRMQRAASYRPGPARPRTACWEPPVDLFETDHELWIQVALPGVAPEKLQVAVEDDTLLVTGDRPLPVPPGTGTIHRLEMPYGCFERRIRLPPGRFELGRRDLALGCLTLTLRKLD